MAAPDSTIAAMAAAAARTLEAHGWTTADARRDAALLARHALGWDPARWLAHGTETAAPDVVRRLTALVARRARHEPVAYLVGEREFFGRSFLVTPDVLIPRPETEHVVEEALRDRREWRGAVPRVLDIGTGSGCLAVTIALEVPGAEVIATDTSEAALEVARLNAQRLGAADRVEFRHVALAGREEDAFDLVVANPPYVAEHERNGLPAEVRDYEPPGALFGGPDGLEVIRALVPAAARALRPGGRLVMEFGSTQAAAVEALVRGVASLTLVRIAPDLAQHPRVMVGKRE